jgi:hypothetical protein
MFFVGASIVLERCTENHRIYEFKTLMRSLSRLAENIEREAVLNKWQHVLLEHDVQLALYFCVR